MKASLMDRIIECVNRSTTPQTGWDVYQKLKKGNKNNGRDGDAINSMMQRLARDGYLTIVGSDPDCGYKFSAPNKESRTDE